MASTPERNGSSRVATRTLAILAKSACSTHRQAIQAHISSNGFAILDERLEQWSFEEDADFLQGFLQDPATDVHADLAAQEQHKWALRLTQGPIYVMVLERQRAAEMWQEICGPDLSEGRVGSVGSDGLPIIASGLRARYGADALYAPPSKAMAERQIAICFPELAAPEALAALHAGTYDEVPPNTVAAVDSNGGFLVREDADIVYDESGQAFDAHNGQPLELQQELVIAKEAQLSSSMLSSADTSVDATQQRVFKAQPLPSSHKQAAIQPRLSRAAALRMGVPLPEPPKRATSSISSDTKNSSNLGISGKPKASVVVPKSLAAPTIAPRMNKNASARTSKGHMASASATSSSHSASPVKERKPVDYSNTPGHKRLSTSAVKVASLAAPTVAPRLNKVAAARVAAGAAGSGGIASEPVVKEKKAASVASPAPTRSLSITSGVSNGGQSSNHSDSQASVVRKPVDFSNTPGHKRASLSTSTLKSLQAPTIVPRANRLSLARTGGAPGGADDAQKARAPPAQSGSRTATRPASAFGHSIHSSSSGKENQAIDAGRERKPVDFSNTPGHRRASSSMGGKIASLAQPTIVPRSNMAAQRRLSVGGVTTATGGAMPASTDGRMHLRASKAPPSAFKA